MFLTLGIINDSDKAEDISTLVFVFENEGNANVNAVCDDNIAVFTADEWKSYTAEEQQKFYYNID